jgi:hypothetical protein
MEMRTGVDGQKAIFAHAASTPREVDADSIRALASRLHPLGIARLFISRAHLKYRKTPRV